MFADRFSRSLTATSKFSVDFPPTLMADVLTLSCIGDLATIFWGSNTLDFNICVIHWMRLRREKKSDAVQEERPHRARLLRAVVVVAVPVAIVFDEGTVAIATEDEKTVEIIETEETETVAIATTGNDY